MNPKIASKPSLADPQSKCKLPCIPFCLLTDAIVCAQIYLKYIALMYVMGAKIHMEFQNVPPNGLP